MNSADQISILNRLLAMLERSCPQYLRWAEPYVPAGRERALDTIKSIGEDQDSLAERVSQQILRLGGLLDTGEFPMEFTDTHDLGIDFLIDECVGYQQQDIAMLESLAATPQLSSAVQALVGDALALGKRHLEALKGLVAARGTSTPA